MTPPPTHRFQPTLRQLRAFVAVYRLRKLSAAAEQLSLTPSAVSVLIAQMEDGLGARLFDRTTRSLRPTLAADEAVLVAERVLRDVESLGSGVRELATLRRGRVQLVVTPTLGEIVLPAALARFAREHPGVRVQVDDCAPDQFAARVLAEGVDFGIGTPERAAAGVGTRTLLRDRLALVLPATHPLAARRSVRWAQLAGQPVITVRPGYGVRPLIDASALRAGVVLAVAHEVSFLATALWMVSAGLGVAVMPSAYATGRPDADRVVRPLVAPSVERDIALVSRRGRSMSPAAQALLAVLRDELARG